MDLGNGRPSLSKASGTTPSADSINGLTERLMTWEPASEPAQIKKIQRLYRRLIREGLLDSDLFKEWLDGWGR